MKPIPIDVICQHSSDGTLIPLRVRFTDEDGEMQAYTINRYKDLSHRGTRQMPDGVYVTNNTYVFECKIIVNNREQIINLYYKPGCTVWTMTVGEQYHI